MVRQSGFLLVLAALLATVLSFAPATSAQPQRGSCTYHGSVFLEGGEFVVTAETDSDANGIPEVVVTITSEQHNDEWSEHQYVVETPAMTFETAWLPSQDTTPLLATPIRHGEIGGMFAVTVRGRTSDGVVIDEASDTFFARRCELTTIPRRTGWAACDAGGYSMSIRWFRADYHHYRIDEVRYLSAAGLDKTAATWGHRRVNPVVEPAAFDDRNSVIHKVAATAERSHLMSASVWVGPGLAETCLLDFNGSTHEPTVSTHHDNYMVNLGWWIWRVNNR